MEPIISGNITKINQVIAELDLIITECKKNNDPKGYFAVLYKKVTARVGQEILNGNFDDGERMEKLDVIFALRYITAYYNWKNKNLISESWKSSFQLSTSDDITVLQHILSGINAHINLDLGIAAFETMKGGNLISLQNDFNKINQLLSSMVAEVQYNLTTIWPPLKYILKKSGKVDDLLVDFSMQVARDGAWKFATLLSATQESYINNAINTRDKLIASKIRLISPTRFSLKLLFMLIRNCEIGSVNQKIKKLEKAL
ncbi:DUF5995 family protein [Marinigracilibium pacificum]|uniref:Uncharacterized protein n=1 Tax=Marinigracilibium pacificum TaxID=2729599 RepID=A0A848IZ51_9BACT|nr:DUF5995 family protein [Marinigracilibium pacificum]NMM47494.1 hypothetical protein [Marinigracilibium pacificum]